MDVCDGAHWPFVMNKARERECVDAQNMPLTVYTLDGIVAAWRGRSRSATKQIVARNWKEVRKNLGQEREARIKARVRDEIGRLSLHQLREARSLTQTSLAELLGIPQGGVSRLERRTDMYVSTLRNYIRAMGGELKITAVFPNGAVEISQFQDVEQQKNG
jgi:hypothetical protein